jgi:tetratricopeptide (TPR) repeat protein
MGWFDRLLGRPRPIELRDGACVIRRRELAAHLERPREAYFGDATERTCDGCGRAMPAALITSGGPLGDPEVWRDVPVCVDGWACVKCGVFHYPRKVEAEAINRFTAEGARCGNAGDFALAEWWFTRIAWDWPGYVPGHINLAEATRTRLARSEGLDPAVERRLTARMRAQYEEAVESYEREPHEAFAAPIARACLALAELAVEDRAPDRARRALATLASLPSVDGEGDARAAELHRYLDLRLDLFQAAARALTPYLDLMQKAPVPVDTPEARTVVVQALADLAAHERIAPEHWQTRWMIAKGRAALGDAAGALELWRALVASHPHERDVVREAALAMLRADAVEEARAVNRAATGHLAGDATIWCNRAVTELLCGDLAEARRCLDRSDALDPNDPIAAAVRRRLTACEKGGAPPRTLRDLERRGSGAGGE